MKLGHSGLVRLALSAAALWMPPAPASDTADATVAGDAQRIEIGRRIYMEGILPSGESMTGFVRGDIPVSGKQAVCAYCHRRSGMGSMEGQDVVPSVTGDILYRPLRLATSTPPFAPTLREAYTNASLKRAIRDGIGVSGHPFQTLMPRYSLSDEHLDSLVAFLKTLSTAPAPGVDDHDIHFATVVSDTTAPGARKALLDLMQTFVAQKNAESRHESRRAEHAPWHKARIFGPYRKWVLHLWELAGPRDSWPGQLEAFYKEQPVFAVLSGTVPGSWAPIHAFCEGFRVPCLFPTTDLPVIDEEDFYTVYLSRGMALESEGIVHHLKSEGLAAGRIVQVYRSEDERAEVAAAALRNAVATLGNEVEDHVLAFGEKIQPGTFRPSLTRERDGETVLVLWLGATDLEQAWDRLGEALEPRRIYLSTALFGTDIESLPRAIGDRVYFVHSREMPDATDRRLLRSTGWLKAKHIYSPDQEKLQADTYFALKMAGGALIELYGYFSREYFLEAIEHMVDNAPYTSVYPRISLAPGQRFASKGCYIARPASGDKGHLQAVTGWMVP